MKIFAIIVGLILNNNESHFSFYNGYVRNYIFPTNATTASWASPLGRYDLPPITSFTYGTEEV